MKKISRVVMMMLFVCTLILSISSFAACSVTDVKLEEADISRSIYVQGQSLDLDNTYLTLFKKKKSEQIPLSHEDVTVEGYDKNTLGEQAVIVKYDDFILQWKVTVIARMVVSNYTRDYVVGGEFNYNKGNVTVANDDGTTFSVKINDPSITISDFDSSEDGPVDVTVTYAKDGASYSSKIKVNIHAVDTVNFSIKNVKTTYYSHEKGIDLSGGYLKWEANDGKLGDTVTLSADMVVEGTFDLSKATPANRVEPLVQTVTLTYANKEKDFEIYIYYSGVSVMHDAYEKLKDIDWSNEEMLEWANEEQDAYLNTVGTELGEIAVDAMEAYYALKDDQKAVVSDEVKETVVRAAAIYGRYRMLDALYQDEKLSNAIVLSADGQISLLVGEKESVIYGKEVFDPSPETLHDFIKYGRFLMKIKADFAKVVYVTSKNIEDKDGNPFVRTVDFELMPVYKEETISNVYEIFNFMLELDAALSTVPENWEADAKANKYYENQVLEAVFTINEHKYDAIAYAPVYESVSSWRNKNDYFDIVYTYFINTDATDATTGKKYKRIYDIMGEVGKIIPLPAAMQELYYYCISAYSEAYQLANNEKYLLVDTSQFMYIYSLVEETKNKILDGDNQLYKDLYDICGFEELINKDVVSAPGGYYDLLGAALENETVKNMWATLIKLFNLENVYYEAVEGKAEQSVIDAAQKKYLAAMKGVIVAFANLSPADQYAFVSSLHNKYADYNYNVFELKEEEDGKISVWSNFAFYGLSYFYNHAFEGKTAPQQLYIELFEAMELYIKCWKKGDYSEYSVIVYDYLIPLYEEMSEEDQDLFDGELGEIYQKYIGYYNDIADEAVYEFDDTWAPVVDKIKDYAGEAVKIGKRILPEVKAASGSESMNTVIKEIMKEGHFAMLFAAYESVVGYEAQILGSGNAELIEAYYRELVTVNNTETTLQGLMYSAKTYYYEFLTFLSVTIGSGEDKVVKLLYDFYKESNAGEFFALAYPVLKVGYAKTESANITLSQADFATIMTAFGNITDDQLSVFSTYGAFNVFFEGVSRITAKYYGEGDASATATAIKDAMNKYLAYVNSAEDGKAAAKAEYIAAVEALKTAWSTVAITDVESVYTYLAEFAEELAKEEASEETPAA